MSNEKSVTAGTGSYSFTISGFIKRYYYSLIGVFALAIVVFGFSRTYVGPMLNGKYSGPLALHIHGAVFMVWILLGIIQPLLVERHKIKLHRKLGVLGFILGGSMVFIGLYVGVFAARLHIGEGADAIETKAFLLTPITDMILFASFILLAIINIKNPQAHKRLITLATLSILPAAYGRIFPLLTWWTESVTINLLLALLLMEMTLYLGIVFDALTRKKVHPVYVWGGLVVIIVHAGRQFLGSTDAWLSIADWIVK